MSEPADDATLEGSLALGKTHTRTDDRPPSLVLGTAVGRYLLLSQVGAGAMGVVFAAYDPQLDRKIALKLLRGSALARAGTRLQREAQPRPTDEVGSLTQTGAILGRPAYMPLEGSTAWM